MKLRATIERTETATHRFIRFIFPKGVKPLMREAILQRNLGARPYGEGFSVNAAGESIVVYSARRTS